MARSLELDVSPGLVLRTPLLPVSALIDAPRPGRLADRDALTAEVERRRTRLRELLARPAVRDAVFVASPDLVAELPAWEAEPDSPRGLRIERALVRYAARMATRATPFGLFSGVSPACVAETTQLTLPPAATVERHTRLDNDYLFALCEALLGVPEIRARLRFLPNSSLYQAAGRLRYAEARVRGKDRSYHLVAVDPTEYLQATLARAADGATPDELAAALVADDPEIEADEAAGFVDELIDAQLLVSDVAPQVTGREAIHGIIERLEDIGAAAAAAALSRARAAIDALDAEGPGAEPARYGAIADDLAALPTKVELARLFQVDLVKPSSDLAVSARVISTLSRAIAQLHRIAPPAGDDRLQSFREAFSRRYEDREVPLVEALDEEAGVGFEVSRGPSADASPLLADLPFGGSAGPPQVRWGGKEWHLLRRLQSVWAASETTLELSDADFDAMASGSPAPLPDAISTMCTVIAADAAAIDRGEFRLLLESGASGPSGARLSGRFCHASEAIEQGVRAHLRAEEQLRPDAVFAEIAHLPEGRIGNILCRPVLRDYEIPYLGVSGAPRDHQLPITDLTVSIQAGRVVLRSTRLGREVLPRLSTAHNYSLRSLGIYRFLCSLQSQRLGYAGWDWGPMGSATFLPRVSWRELVFARATYNLTHTELEPLAAAAKGEKAATTPAALAALRGRTWDAVQALRDARGLPRLVVVADADNELAVDLDDPLSVDSFANLVKNRRGTALHELYPGPGELPVHGPEGAYAHELVVSFVQRREPATTTLSPVPTGARRFEPGSSWLFAKLYSGEATADEVLRDAVAPVVRDAIASGAADQWFYLRYGDPDWHVRVRLHGDPARLAGEVLPALHAAVAPLRDEGKVWRVNLDTYERELERYGGPRGIELFEALSHADSDAVLGIVSLLEGDEGADARWRLTLAGCDMLLSDLGLSLEDKLSIVRRARETLGNEFGVQAAFGKKLGQRYRAEKPALDGMLDPVARRDPAHPLAPGFELLAARSTRMAPIAAALREADAAGQLSAPLTEIAWSYLHMHANRLLRSAARAQELVIYDLLKRSYEAARARVGRE